MKIKSIYVKDAKVKPIKPFKTLEEEANFWDTHDLSMLFDNPKTPLSKLPLLEPEKKATLIIRLQESLKDRINKIARFKGINVSTLARMWLAEKAEDSKISFS